jgi:Hemolysins and related proteins containing CBS domains
MGLDLLFTFFLVFLNGFFVAAEFAIVKVRTTQIEIRKGAGKRAAAAAKSVVSNLDGYLAATQLGITLASLGLGWVGESVFTKIIYNFFHWAGFGMSEATAQKAAIPVAFLLITILHIVLGELAPKSLAIRKPVPVTFTVAIPLRLFYIIFRPFIWLLNGLANVLLRLIGIRPVQEGEEIHSEEELKVIISESQRGGILEETEKELIQNVFNLGDRQIQSLMTPRNEIAWIDVNAGPEEIGQLILNEKHTVYPLCEGDLDNVIGFLHTKDLIAELYTKQTFNALTKELKRIVREDQSVIATNKAYDVLENFQKKRSYQALVIDEFGSVKGFVTINDILDALVGDISETDEFEYTSELQEDGSLLIEGQIPFVEFLEKIGYDQDYFDPNANYVTLGGYVMEELGKIPSEGDIARWRSFTLEIVKMDHNRVDKIKVSSDNSERSSNEEE